MKKKFVLYLMAILAVSLLAGCQNTAAPTTNEAAAQENTSSEVEEAAGASVEEPVADSEEAAVGESAEESEANEEPAAEKSLVAATFWLGSDLDPANGWNGWGLSRAAICESLATVDENMEIVPVLADSWEIVDDTTWKFHIRQGVKFSNGKDVTAEAVMASLERVVSMDDRAQSNAKLDYLEVDGEYLIYHTTEPYAALAANLTEPLFSIIDVEQDADTIAQAPVCTGPYMVTSWIADTEVSVVANPDYWDGKPGLDSFTLKSISDSDTRAMALQAGDIDIAQKLAATSVSLFEENPEYELVGTSSLRVSYVILNQNNEYLSDLNIRKALSYGIDRAALALIEGNGYEACGAAFPSSVDYGFDELEKQSYDAQQAIELLQEAGFSDSDGDGFVDKDGQNLVLTFSLSSSSTLAEAIQAQLKEIGIDIRINMMENVNDIRAKGEYDLLMSNYITATTGDGERFLRQNYSSAGTDNFGFYNNPDFDTIVTDLSHAFDTAERRALIIEGQQILIDDVANLFLVSDPNNTVVSAAVQNLPAFPIDYYLMTKDVTIE